MNLLKDEHILFVVSITIKFIEGLIETLMGLFLFFFPPTLLQSLLMQFVKIELSEDPTNLISHYLLNSINSLSLVSQHFLGFYLLSHGLIKVVLVYFLLRKRYWAYPVAIVGFSLFTFYQVYLYAIHHAPWMIILIILDILIVILTALEYKHVRRNLLPKSNLST